MAATGEPRRRGRPRRFDPDQALSAVRTAFWDNGYAATSLDDLSAATGLNRPSLYGAFGDKRALFLKALERSRDESLAGLAAALDPALPLRRGLEQVYAAAIRIYLGGAAGPRGCFVVGAATVEAVGDADARRVLAETLNGLDTGFEARFETARGAGELAAGANPKALALIATAALNTLALRARAGAPRAELEAVAVAAIRLLGRAD